LARVSAWPSNSTAIRPPATRGGFVSASPASGFLKQEFRRAGTHIGADGTEVFVLEGVGSGATTIEADYQRAWEAAPISPRRLGVRIGD
jgi:hypothetical protein